MIDLIWNLIIKTVLSFYRKLGVTAIEICASSFMDGMFTILGKLTLLSFYLLRNSNFFYVQMTLGGYNPKHFQYFFFVTLLYYLWFFTVAFEIKTI